MKRKKHLVKITAATVICLTVFLAVLFGNAHISAESYSVSLQILGGPVRIVLLSDLHGKSFGRENSRLIAKIQEQTPDAIFLDGDMIDRSADPTDVQELLRLIKRLHEIAPVYFAPGNHELEYMQTDTSLLTQVAEAGAVVVNDSYADVTLAGQPLRIGGTMGHAFYFGRSEEEFSSSPEYQFLKAFEDTDVPKICLAHMPDTFIFNGAFLQGQDVLRFQQVRQNRSQVSGCGALGSYRMGSRLRQNSFSVRNAPLRNSVPLAT